MNVNALGFHANYFARAFFGKFGKLEISEVDDYFDRTHHGVQFAHLQRLRSGERYVPEIWRSSYGLT